MVATRDTLAMFKRMPVFGGGFGSYHHLFPLFQSKEISLRRWSFAHNDYAQLLAEGGVIGAFLVVLGGVFFVAIIRRRFSHASKAGRLMVGGLSVGILAIALHSIVDFSLHMPGNALLLATLCGMSVAAVHLRDDPKRSSRGRLRKHESKKTPEEEAAASFV